MRVGIIGLGRMGAAMAVRLTEKGHAVTGWDIDPDARARSTTISVLESPKAVVEASDAIITSLPDDGRVMGLFCTKDGIAEADIAGRIFIETSTLRPRSAGDLAARLNARRAEMIDSPVLGSIPAVRAGTLLALVGGTTSALERATPVLADLTARIYHMGESGSGYATKLAVNIGLAGYVQILTETLALSERYGLARDKVLEILQSGPTGNPWLKTKLGALTGGTSDLTLDLVTLRKDLLSALAAGADRGVPMPQTAANLSVYSAAVAADWGSKDSVELVHFFIQNMLQDRASTAHEQ